MASPFKKLSFGGRNATNDGAVFVQRILSLYKSHFFGLRSINF